MYMSRLGMMGGDCRCSSTWPALPAVACPIRTGSAFGENLPERLDRLIGEGRLPPVVVAFPDCFTRLGGNQYINSVSIGAWEDFLLNEMLPSVEQRFGCGGNGRRGVFGKSSGGYGAIMHALRHADVWAAAACHSGDMGFELCYLPDMPATLRALAGVDNSIERWWQQLEVGPEAPRWFLQGVQYPGHGGQLRSGSDAIPRDTATGHIRHLRGHRANAGRIGCGTTPWSRLKHSRTICVA